MTLPASSMLGATARKAPSEAFLFLGRLPDAGNRPRTYRPASADAQARARPPVRSTRVAPAGPGPHFARFYGIDPRGPSPFLPRIPPLPRRREIHSRPDLIDATERALASSRPILFYRRGTTRGGARKNPQIESAWAPSAGGHCGWEPATPCAAGARE